MTIDFQGSAADLRRSRITGRDVAVHQPSTNPGGGPVDSPVSPEAILASSRTARAASGTALAARPGSAEAAIAAATMPPPGPGQRIDPQAERTNPHQTDRGGTGRSGPADGR